MAQQVSTLIISQPLNWNEAWAPDGLCVKKFMKRQFPEYDFLLSAVNPFQIQDRFGLIPIMGTAGDGDSVGMLEPVPAETMEAMYDALARYGGAPTVN